MSPSLLLSRLLAASGPPLARRRLLLFGAGGLALAGLLGLQSLLERAEPTSAPPVEPPSGTLTGALPDYASFAAPVASEPAWWVVFSGLALKLLVVLLLIYATVWLLRRYLGRAPGVAGPATAMRLLHSTPLGQHQALHMVEVGDRLLVVGATTQHITLLTEITDTAAVSELRARAGHPSAASPRAFDAHLADALATPAAAGPSSPMAAPPHQASVPPTTLAPPAPATRRPQPSPRAAVQMTGSVPPPARALPQHPTQPPGDEPPASNARSPQARLTGPDGARPLGARPRTVDAALRDGREAVQRQVAALRLTTGGSRTPPSSHDQRPRPEGM